MTKCTLRTVSPWFVAALAALVWVGFGADSVLAREERPVTFSELVDKSGQIFVAVCEQRTTDFRAAGSGAPGGMIVTSYRLRPLEFWKGDGQIQTNADGTVTMEVLGGSLKVEGATPDSSLQMGAHVLGSIPMIPGEEVLLFTASHTQDPQAVQRVGLTSYVTPGSPYIINMTEGRFSILTDPDSGAKYVVRPRTPRTGMTMNGIVLRGFLNQQQQLLEDPQFIIRAREAVAASRQAALDAGNTELAAKIRDFESLEEVKLRVGEKIDSTAP